jgi:methylaspartate mutase epsilon subunit
MGLFPETKKGYEKILKESVQLAALSGAKRLIVKTREESRQIPTVASNLASLSKAHEFAGALPKSVPHDLEEEELIFSQAAALIDCVLNLDQDIGAALYKAFQKGYLDVPFCLHPDNRRLATCAIDHQGYLQWISSGNLPIPLKRNKPHSSAIPALTSQKFLEMLAFNRQKFDACEAS